jgi:small GTP-binding protein
MGQGGVGKTAMVLRYTTGDFNEQYMPTIGDMYTKDVEVFGAPRHIEIDDTAGQEAYADLKKEKMSTGDGYVLVYSITDDTTFSKLDRVRDEITRAQEGRPIPIFLVGTKKDLEADRAVSEKERAAKARQWNCQSFEVSSKTNDGVDAVFEQMVQAVLSVSSDPTKGGGGGSVMGAGKVAAVDDGERTFKKKKCSIL